MPDFHTCQQCRRVNVPARFVERLSASSTLWTVPARCVQCDPGQRPPWECPRCGQFSDSPTVCGPCRDRDRAPQGDVMRLFEPAPAQIPGQASMDLAVCGFCDAPGATDEHREEHYAPIPCCADEDACKRRVNARNAGAAPTIYSSWMRPWTR